MPSLSGLSDEELFALLQDDKRKAYHEIYDRYKAAMLVYAGKRVSLDVAEDLVHDVFIRIWNNRNHLELNERFVGYLFKSLRNRIIDHMAKDANSQLYVESLKTFSEALSPEMADDKIREELFLIGIQNLLKSFNPQYLEIFNLRIEGFNNQEIADKLGISEKTVRNQYSLVLKHLREKLPFLMLFLLRF